MIIKVVCSPSARDHDPKDKTLRVLLNGIDITGEATEHSRDRMVFRRTSCTSMANLTPTAHYLSPEIVNGNDRIVASKTASLTTTFQDLFDILTREYGVNKVGNGRLMADTLLGASMKGLLPRHCLA